MPGYLLDTNHFSAWERGDPVLLERVRSRGVENIIWLCPIVLGEIEFGLLTASSKDHVKQEKCRVFIRAEAEHSAQRMDVDTGRQYAYVLSKIYEKHPKTDPDQKTQDYLTEIKVDINDVWLAAIALTHNLILVTHDDMPKIRECVPELRFDDWLV